MLNLKENVVGPAQDETIIAVALGVVYGAVGEGITAPFVLKACTSFQQKGVTLHRVNKLLGMLVALGAVAQDKTQTAGGKKSVKYYPVPLTVVMLAAYAQKCPKMTRAATLTEVMPIIQLASDMLKKYEDVLYGN